LNYLTGAAVQKISEKEELRSQWKDDPLMRNDFSPRDFMLFDKFMSKNLTAASMVKTIPVLFIQGTEDKLIRPAGTWKLYEQLGTPNRQLVLSKSGEHLIFEEGQFKPEDIGFVTMWINKNITQLDPKVANTGALPVVASKDSYTGNIPPILEEKKDKPVQVAAIPAAPAPKEFQHKIAAKVAPQINFWIELYRDGKVYRCNNKMQFKSGDSIRFHLIPQTDGYAYLVMKASTTGKSDVLFPHKEYGTQNFLNKDTDYTIPAKGWMQFDQNPGTEQLGLLFAANKVDVTPEALKNRTLTCFVSPTPGAKDICPTRMKLSWDDPTPVVIPEDFEGISQLANAEDSSLVRLRSTGGIVAASIQLLHGR